MTLTKEQQASRLGDWLTDVQVELDRSEAGWLLGLALFDDRRGWADDGQRSCVRWLQWRFGMSRATAFEKVRVARSLRQRPVIRAALFAGEISYSQARIITRLLIRDDRVDQLLVDFARSEPIEQLELAVDFCRDRLASAKSVTSESPRGDQESPGGDSLQLVTEPGRDVRP
ncbi:MAG TPA: DUF222 domain-containing protein [Acidimicrobiales bacterium]|nr:DUF222 domain-containing protein [Acidimicrobiales bacterium]